MKTIPPPCPYPETGPKYWRSLDELADTPEFKEFVEREFPAGASELNDGVSRRNFVKLMGSSFLLAGFGLTGCRRPVEHIVPFTRLPQDYIHGGAQFYATAMPTRVGAIPLLVKATDGRPIKIEGNPDHPDSNGGTNLWAQASILNLYDVDRAKRFTRAGNSIDAQTAFQYLTQLANQWAQNGGEGVAFLSEPSNSPSRDRIKGLLAQRYPKARWFVHDTVGSDVHERAATSAFGQPVRPYYQFAKASVIVSLDCDFVNEEEGWRYQRGFAEGRKLRKSTDNMNRLYVIESLMTLAGVNSDHRLRVPASMVAQKAVELANAVLNNGATQDKWIAECAKGLLANKGKVLVIAGERQPMAVHILALAINNALGGIGSTVLLHQAPQRNEGSLVDLAQALDQNQIKTLIITGSNPAYDAPVDLAPKLTAKKGVEVLRLGYSEDETFAISDWHFPRAHYLESWGDARTSDGTYVAIQPLIEPLFGGITELEFLAALGGQKPNAHQIVRETFSATVSPDENAWRTFLHDGFIPKSAAQPVSAQIKNDVVNQALSGAPKAPSLSKDNLEVVFYRDAKLDDGRYANNGWLQELPDPLTKIAWENAILVSPETARSLGFHFQDFDEKQLYFRHSVLGKVSMGGKEIQGPVWIQPGMADNVIGLALGYGRPRPGRVGQDAGFNAYALRTSATPHFVDGAKLNQISEAEYRVACTQNHWAMEGRPIVREANLAQYKEYPKFAKTLNLEEPPIAMNRGMEKRGDKLSNYPNPLERDKADPNIVHQWGMSIDLNACTGCSACSIACVSENNIAVVGKEQVWRQREMHWLRIDRYYTGDVNDPQVVNQPMLCQHCEAAPCENVCPVNATVHDEEGLNLMVYNRCVGTRYCSNNCPYKVRRFNFFDWNKRPMQDRHYPFYPSPLTDVRGGELDLVRWLKNVDRTNRPADEWELLKLVKNPDVTVRMRGVMEKCTFCVQRIEGAKIAQKVKAGPTNNVTVPDGTIKTACQQACPTGAIVFGNIKDANSEVSKLKNLDRDYSVLDFLYTRPRLTYLARVRNPNPAMPDYREFPISTEEYVKKMHVHGNPYKETEAGHANGEHGAAEGAHEAGAKKEGTH
jgi:MoCo/4Fe-4S cofactor protein with predicted Tat translocation signal